MKKFINFFAATLPALLFIYVSVSPVSAFLFQSGDNLVLPKEKIINEMVVIAGQSLTIDANINGDLLCAGRDIIVNGTVKGDILCVGQNIKVNGPVDGNVRVAGQSIEVTNQISRNLMTASQSLVLGPKSNIKGDIMFGVQSVQLGGMMGRDLAGAGESIKITGSLLRNATITGTNISVLETAKVGGNFDYYLEETSKVSVDQKNVKGTITRHDIKTSSKPEMKKEDMVRFAGEAMVYKTIYGILSFAVLGLFLIYLDRKNTEKRIAQISAKPLVSGLIGFAVLITAPIALIIVMITLIGMPLAMISLFVYIIALFIASLYPSAIYGKLVLEKVFQKKNSNLYAQMLLGVTLLGLVSIIPVVGWMIAFASFCMGLGAFLLSLSPEKK
ncbi:MAG TPA: polymer-forming cytoskeletal protein [Spirochaetia bacterium]|nr:polymer-forming cytoskeletal protein [Spirochaetia bacterium]